MNTGIQSLPGEQRAKRIAERGDEHRAVSESAKFGIDGIFEKQTAPGFRRIRGELFGIRCGIADAEIVFCFVNQAGGTEAADHPGDRSVSASPYGDS